MILYYLKLNTHNQLSVYQATSISFLRSAGDVKDELRVSHVNQIAYCVGIGKSKLLLIICFAIGETIFLAIFVELNQMLADLFEGGLFLYRKDEVFADIQSDQIEFDFSAHLFR